MKKIPSGDLAERAFVIGCRSKRGESITQEDSQFMDEMWTKYQNWYSTDLRDRIFNATVPIGSNVRIKDGKIVVK